MSDNVNHPKHYQKEGRPECIQEMFEKFGATAVYWFSKLSAYKYRYREGEKDGNPAEQDEAKAVWYDNKEEEMRRLGAPSGWVKCSERLPDEPGIHVLVTDGVHIMESWYEIVEGEALWVDNYTMYVNIQFGNVTHWMPLPDAPKEVNE